MEKGVYFMKKLRKTSLCLFILGLLFLVACGQGEKEKEQNLP